jgi:hypothetical protein
MIALAEWSVSNGLLFTGRVNVTGYGEETSIVDEAGGSYPIVQGQDNVLRVPTYQTDADPISVGDLWVTSGSPMTFIVPVDPAAIIVPSSGVIVP